MSKKRITKINEMLNRMNRQDTYSMMMFTLYKLRSDPDYLTLSELAYVLDRETLSKFLSLFGGMTLKIPTNQDMKLMLQAMLLYQYTNVEQQNFEDGLRALTGPECPEDALKAAYTKITEVMANYEFDTQPAESVL